MSSLGTNLDRIVFSTYVEVILAGSKKSVKRLCILHVCGGDPIHMSLLSFTNLVFSTYVEVIPNTLMVVPSM